LPPYADIANREDLCGFGGAEGDRTTDLMSAIHETEFCRDHEENIGETNWRVAAQPRCSLRVM